MQHRPALAARLPRHQRGVTLIESLAVIAIAAVLAGGAASSFSGLAERQRVAGAATELRGDLQFLKSEGLRRGQSLHIAFDQRADGGSCYVVHTGSRGDCSCGSGEAVCQGSAEAVKTVALRGTDGLRLQGNARRLTFDPVPSTFSPTATLEVAGNGGSVVRHKLSLLGRVASCAASGSVGGLPRCAG